MGRKFFVSKTTTPQEEKIPPQGSYCNQDHCQLVLSRQPLKAPNHIAPGRLVWAARHNHVCMFCEDIIYRLLCASALGDLHGRFALKRRWEVKVVAKFGSF